MRLKLISCQVFCHEVAAVARKSPHDIKVEFLSKGLHEIPCAQMAGRIQQSIDATRMADFDVVLLAYGFCNHGIAGLKAREIPLVVPRAHDCVTILMGREKSDGYRATHPGAYYQSSGWIEHRTNPAELDALSTARRNGLYATRDEFAARYGEEHADYLHEQLGLHTRHYSQLTYINSGLKKDAQYATKTAAEAQQRGWSFEEVPGDLSLLQRLVNGDWVGDDFLIVPRGQRIAASYDKHLIKAEPDEAP
ncbi:MAG: DUF1638 domain-containing protein [Verrucomicrobiaceae bacterium]|nr:DUF1638 domain-containing protein [Verrucomicrobiaceae bacterium]